MTLNDLVSKLNLEIKPKLNEEEQKVIDAFNEVAKIMYMHIRQLSTRGDLTMWYQESSLNCLKGIDKLLEEKK